MDLVHLRNVDLNLLLIFDALMEKRYVTRAGQRVGLTQPAMSSALGRLRHVLQDDVLVRTPAGMEPTPRACALWESIRQILRHTERVLTQTTVFTASTAQRTFRLRMSDIFLLLSMPTIAALETDAIDLALSTGLAVPSTMDRLALLQDELVCLVRRDHPQASVPLDMAAFLTVRHVKIAQSPLDTRFIDGQLADQGLARTIGLTVEDWLAVPHIVAGSDLLAVMPRSIAERYTTTCPIVLVPVPCGQHHLTWCLYWHKRHTADAGHRWLRDVIHNVTVGEMSSAWVNASGRGPCTAGGVPTVHATDGGGTWGSWVCWGEESAYEPCCQHDGEQGDVGMTQASPPLQSTTYTFDEVLEVNAFSQEKGWTDSLPIVPPTAAQVAACLEAAHLAPGEVIGVERVRQRRLIAEQVAVHTVMAGCRPTSMPVVVAMLRSMCQEAFNRHGSTASTGGSAQCIVVNGPIRTALGMNATHNVLAHGNRANATIGRAVHLV